MFKNLLIDWVTELNEKIATVGDSGYLTISLSAFNPTLYAYIKTIMSTVVMPVAYVILALFCLLELYRCSVQADGAASGTTFSLEIVGKANLNLTPGEYRDYYNIAIDVKDTAGPGGYEALDAFISTKSTGRESLSERLSRACADSARQVSSMELDIERSHQERGLGDAR